MPDLKGGVLRVLVLVQVQMLVQGAAGFTLAQTEKLAMTTM